MGSVSLCFQSDCLGSQQSESYSSHKENINEQTICKGMPNLTTVKDAQT